MLVTSYGAKDANGLNAELIGIQVLETSYIG
jgi:hypothetical protein